MYKAMDVANYVIDYCNANQQYISNLKLQKILYFIQAEFLVAKEEPCFKEPIEAWDFGPVVPEVYYQYKVYGGGLIPAPKSRKYFFNEQDKQLIQGIINECARYSSAALVDITHKQKPWKIAYDKNRRYSNFKGQISNESIYNFFKED